MKLIFPGTRGAIEPRSPTHYRHSCLLIEAPEGRILIDFGKDWTGMWAELSPDKLLLSHAHTDHVGGLTSDPGCAVFASAETWSKLPKVRIADPRTFPTGRAFSLCGLRFLAFPLQHSLNAPAVGFRIGDGDQRFFYASDVLRIPEARAALAGVRLYIGDGASPTRPLVRHQDHAETGHASIVQQLEWCAAAEIPQAIFTHCGSVLVNDSTGEVAAGICETGRKMGVETRIAYDGMQVEIAG